jgi:hypothetical protein
MGEAMKIHLLEVTIYQDNGLTWRTKRIRNPSWDEVEATIRRLDGFYYPFVSLYQNADVKEFALPNFKVTGGESEFALTYCSNGTAARYFDATRGDYRIDIWRSDQGAAPKAKNCCSSLDIVLHAVQYFCEHGIPDPNLTWQPCTPSWLVDGS